MFRERANTNTKRTTGYTVARVDPWHASTRSSVDTASRARPRRPANAKLRTPRWTHQPRTRHSSSLGRSAPSVPSSPCPGRNQVSSGSSSKIRAEPSLTNAVGDPWRRLGSRRRRACRPGRGRYQGRCRAGGPPGAAGRNGQCGGGQDVVAGTGQEHSDPACVRRAGSRWSPCESSAWRPSGEGSPASMRRQRRTPSIQQER